MKFLAALVPCALITSTALSTTADARPRIIEDSASIENPNPARYRSFGFDTATNGEYAFIAASDTITDYELSQYYVLLYRRVNGQWTFQSELIHREFSDTDYTFPVELAMDGNFAVVGLVGSSYEYHLAGGTWTQGPRLSGDPSYYIRMNGGRALLSNERGWGADVAERDASGTWTTTLLLGQPHCCDDEFWGGPLAILGDRAILGTPYTYDEEPQEIPIYQRSGPQSWNLLTKLQVPNGVNGLGAAVGLNGDDAIVDGTAAPMSGGLPSPHRWAASRPSTAPCRSPVCRPSKAAMAWCSTAARAWISAAPSTCSARIPRVATRKPQRWWRAMAPRLATTFP